MDTALALLLNIVYGFLFFLSMGVLLLTIGAFAMALWSKVATLRHPERETTD